MSTDGPLASTPAAQGPSHGRRFVVSWLVLSGIATPLVAVFLGPIMPPGNGSTQASEQVVDNTVLISVMTPVCVFVILFLVYALLVFRVNGEAVGDGPPDHGSRGIQVLWLVVTTAIVMSLAGFGSYELVKDGAGGGQGPSAAFLPAGHAHAMNVQVIAQQWQFTYRYPGYGGVETVHLELPAHTLVELHVTSLDVVHSFWANELGVKADANPGVDNVVYVQLKGPMTFHIRCAEVCGLWHGYMFDTGQVVPRAQFNAWIAKERTIMNPVERYLPPYATSYLPGPADRGG